MEASTKAVSSEFNNNSRVDEILRKADISEDKVYSIGEEVSLIIRSKLAPDSKILHMSYKNLKDNISIANRDIDIVRKILRTSITSKGTPKFYDNELPDDTRFKVIEQSPYGHNSYAGDWTEGDSVTLSVYESFWVIEMLKRGYTPSDVCYLLIRYYHMDFDKSILKGTIDKELIKGVISTFKEKWEKVIKFRELEDVSLNITEIDYTKVLGLISDLEKLDLSNYNRYVDLLSVRDSKFSTEFVDKDIAKDLETIRKIAGKTHILTKDSDITQVYWNSICEIKSLFDKYTMEELEAIFKKYKELSKQMKERQSAFESKPYAERKVKDKSPEQEFTQEQLDILPESVKNSGDIELMKETLKKLEDLL